MIFYFLYYFSSFHFIFIHSRFISFFLFSFFLFLLFSSTQVSSPPSFIFLFTSRTFQQLICFTSERERERELLVRRPTAGGNRDRRKDKPVEIGVHHVALPRPPPHRPRPPPHHLGQIGVLFPFFFFFFFSIFVCSDSTLF